MNKAEHLSNLKLLKIERRNGALFSSSDECMQWIDNVLPLLKYDPNHYEDFYYHSQYVRLTSLSADTLMAHLNPMIGIVSQAITELENNIESPAEIVPVHNPAAHSSTDKSKNAHNWHEMPFGKIAIGVVTTIIGACALYLIATHFGVKLN